MERREWRLRVSDHRIGVLLFDTKSVMLADLDSGLVAPVDWTTLFQSDRPELQLLPNASLPPAVDSVPLSLSEAELPGIDDNCRFVLWEPVALRVDAGRVLAWDSALGLHTELDNDALRVVDRLRDPASVVDLVSEGFGVDVRAIVRSLLRLHLITRSHSDTAIAGSRDLEISADSQQNREEQHGPYAEGRSATWRGPNDHLSASGPLEAPRRFLRSFGAMRRKGQAPALDQTAGLPDSRVPVIPLYHFAEQVEVDNHALVDPSLAVGMLMGYARSVNGGRLNEIYDLRRIQPDPERVLGEWAASPVPAVFVFSNYVWNCEQHLELSRRVKEISPESLCIHGGPNAPKYEGDALQFFADNQSVDVLARGEGEYTFVDILTTLDGNLKSESIDGLGEVLGITYRRRSVTPSELIRTSDRPRPTDLDEFPSPYLTGEFDDLRVGPWRWAAIETNRGCPYGCTFCDWGSSTLARIRKFDLERVKAEIEWIISSGAAPILLIADANFGIYARDVEIVEHIVNLQEKHNTLVVVIFAGIAKNTIKHTRKIYELLSKANLAAMASPLALQTTDEDVLAAVDRKNIRTETYDELAAEFDDISLPKMTDLMMGLPGSSLQTFKNDLQHCFDRDITARIFPVRLLPNSPMNAPDYREKYRIRTNDVGIVNSTSTYDEYDFERMGSLRLIFRVADHLGIMRHFLKYLQWDYGVPAAEVLDQIDLAIRSKGSQYPLLSFLGRVMDIYTTAPVAWVPFYDELQRFTFETFGIEADSAFQSVIDLQLALAPSHGRTFPHEVSLRHDLVSYSNEHMQAVGAGRPLIEYGPVKCEITDPGQVCETRILRNNPVEHRLAETGSLFWIGLDWELDSVFARSMFSNSYLFKEK